MVSWMIDLLILALLAVALAWGAVLARRIARLQAALIDLAPALQAFSDAVDQSERSVGAMRAEADRMQAEAERLPLQRAQAAPATRSSRAANDRSALVRSFFETARARGNA